MSAPTPRPEVYSHSRLSAFESCPKKFEYRYVQRIDADSESIEGFLGKRVHEVLERLYRFAHRGQVPSLARVLNRFRVLWEEQYEPERVRVVREEMHADVYRESGERCLSNYYRRHYPFDADETLGIEQRVTFALDAEGSYRMQGVIDRVVRSRDGGIEIHDYKTGARVPGQQQLDRDRQLALYQLGLARRYGSGQPFRLVWHYLLSDQVRRSTRSAEQLEALRHETIDRIEQIRAETEWAPRPGPLCRWCEYRERCPAQGGSPDARRAVERSVSKRRPASRERDAQRGQAPQARAASRRRARSDPGERSQTSLQLTLL